MNTPSDRAFGAVLRGKREAAGLSQAALSLRMRWPQAKLSRVEQGKRSVTLPELLSVSQAFRCSVNELLGAMESRPVKGVGPRTAEGDVMLSPAFAAALNSEDVLLAHLARLGVRFLGERPLPVLATLSLDETVLAGLAHMHDPRVFESLPALVMTGAGQVDWHKLAAAAYSLGLQNRLGAVLATALRLKDSESRVGPWAWSMARDAHDALAQRRLVREEVVGPRPKTEAALALLRRRTPPWLRFWHVLGSGDLDSSRRHLPR